MAALGPGDLVLCSGTLPRATDFATRLEAAVAGGFSAVSLWGRDYAAARAEGWSDADLRAMLGDRGLAVAELDPAWWWTPGAAEVRIPPELDDMDVFRFGEAELFAVADAVGARSLNAVDVFGGRWDLDQAAEALAGLADRAAEHGLLVHLEFLPWSRIPDARRAVEVVAAADRPNLGIAVDSWHFFRGDPDHSALRAAGGARVLAVQWNDAPAAPEADLMAATLHRRRLPGDGGLDLRALAATLETIGSAAPHGVEVFSDELHARGALEAAARAGDATRRLLGRT